jgi:hypothetical protein
VNGDLIPAMVAAGGGSAMLGGIWLRERRLEEAMLASRVRLSMRFPMALDPIAANLALNAIAGISERMELVLEVAVTVDGVTHAMLVPQSVRASVVSGLTAAIPALRVADAPEPKDATSRVALRVFVPTPCVLASEHPEVTLRNLAGLTLRPGERLTVRIAIRPDRPRPLRTREPMDAAAKEIERSWRLKTRASMAGFRISGLGLVQASSAGRARALEGHLASILRGRRGSVSGLRLTSERSGRSMGSLPRVRNSSGWVSATELLPLLMWPLGDAAIPGVEVGARELLVPRGIPRHGRVLFDGRDASGERPVALSAEAARHHTIVVGTSGTGKSTQIGGSTLMDIEHGYAGVVIDPKGPDLINAILERVRPSDAERMVVLDPGDSSRAVPSIDVLGGNSPDLSADVLVGTLRSIFSEWGIRSEIWGRLAIRTLSEVPDATLADMGRLFAEEPYRRAAIARLRDPFLVSSWQSYEALSPAAKAEVVQAPMARVMALLSRPRVRAVLANPSSPKLDIPRLFAERKWLLVSLAPGVLGEAAAALIGSAVMYAVWSAIEARVALPPEKRSPIFLYVDELATLTNGTPFGFELLAERARGLGAGLTVAIQTLGRIPEPTRSALNGNAATFITFRAVAKEAPALAAQVPPLSEADIIGLGRFEVAARIGTGTGSTVAVVTGRTRPLPPPTGKAEAIRDRSARLYGAVPHAKEHRQELPDQGDDGALGRTRRRT